MDALCDAVNTIESPHNPPPGGMLNTADAVNKLASWLLAAKRPIAFDADGVELRHDSRMALVKLSDGNTFWSVDVVVLGRAAFEGGGLKEVLESGDVLKVILDEWWAGGVLTTDEWRRFHNWRFDTKAALYSQFGVCLSNCYNVNIAGLETDDPKRATRIQFVENSGVYPFLPPRSLHFYVHGMHWMLAGIPRVLNFRD